MIQHIKSTLGDLHLLDLSKIHMKRRWVHVIRACAINTNSIDEHNDVILLKSPQDHIVCDAPFPYLPQTFNTSERFSHVLGGAFSHLTNFQGLYEIGSFCRDRYLLSNRFNFQVDIQGRDLSSVHCESLADKCLESCYLRGNAVHSRME